MTITILLAVFAIPAAPAQAARDGVRAVLDAQAAAWNRGDLDGFMAGYWKSPELTFFSGNAVTKGWQATLERYRKRYRDDGRPMGKLAFKDLDIQMLGADAALVRGRFELLRGEEKSTGLFTLLVRRFPEGWRIVHDHTSG
jgi:beta-aspartyl-peptidase (threonine type)